jgi:hypothetical protein
MVETILFAIATGMSGAAAAFYQYRSEYDKATYFEVAFFSMLIIWRIRNLK